MRQSCPKSCPSLQHPEAGFYRTSCKAGETITIHNTHISSILFLTKGKCVIESNEVRGYDMNEGQMVLCYQDFIYDFVASTDIEFLVCYFAKPGAACNMGALSSSLRKNKDFCYEFSSLPFRGGTLQIIEMLSMYLYDDICCAHLHHSMMELVFVNIRFYYSEDEQLNFFYNLFGHHMSFTTLVENNRSKAKNLKQLAQMCGYTVNQFNDLFRRHFPDTTPREWIQSTRKVEILNDIKYTDLRLLDISDKYGFSGPGNFCAYCKREFGRLPSHIRREVQQEKV